jgi:hypothetical protein
VPGPLVWRPPYTVPEGLDVLVIEANARAGRPVRVLRSKTILVFRRAFRDRSLQDEPIHRRRSLEQMLIAEAAKAWLVTGVHMQ